MLAMSLLAKEHAASHGQGPSTYAPIVQALTRLSDSEKARLRRKFDIAYLVATENMSFLKYPVICDLEKKHGLDIGVSYTNERSGRTFVHYIAEARRQELAKKVVSAKFYSLLTDGSTDKGNIDNEAVLTVWCDSNGTDEKIHTRISYLSLIRPKFVTGEGLFEVLVQALKKLGIEEVDVDHCKQLIGIGTDGTSANIANAGLKGIVESKLEWIVWMWCLAHRLELGIKDALKGTYFDEIDDMLLRLYYIYERSPKKCRELNDIVIDLQQFLTFNDDAGIKPVRASGTRWITHKLSAMKRILSKFGAYTEHLSTLSEDSSVKSSDCAKLRGYYLKWTHAKYILGCALFIDLLTPCSIFSKLMQSEEIDIVAALTSLLKTLREMEKLASKPITQWATYSATCAKFVTEGSGSASTSEYYYQAQKVKYYVNANEYFVAHYKDYCKGVSQCIKSRLEWSDLELMRDIIVVLNTQGWEKLLEENNPLDEVLRLVVRFKVPLQGAEAVTDDIHREFTEMMDYAVSFISLSTLEYRSVWWRLFNAPSKSDWRSALLLVELLFSLPASNGTVERVFSMSNVIKTDKRSLLSEESFDDLLLLNSSKIPLTSFVADQAIDLWWSDKTRRPNQNPRKKYKKA